MSCPLHRCRHAGESHGQNRHVDRFRVGRNQEHSHGLGPIRCQKERFFSILVTSLQKSRERPPSPGQYTKRPSEMVLVTLRSHRPQVNQLAFSELLAFNFLIFHHDMSISNCLLCVFSAHSASLAVDIWVRPSAALRSQRALRLIPQSAKMKDMSLNEYNEEGAMGEFSADEAKRIAVPSYRMLLFTCCAVTGACYLGSFMRVPVIPLYALSFGADAFQVGAINAAFLLMAGIVSLPLGLLSDRLGRKLLIVTGLALAAGASFLLSFSSSTVQLVAIHLLLGVRYGDVWSHHDVLCCRYHSSNSPWPGLWMVYPGAQRGHECGAGDWEESWRSGWDSGRFLSCREQ